MSEKTIHSDEPAGEDTLNRNQYAETFARLSETCDTPMVIGLYGGWGMGKTTLMKLIQQKLDPEKTRAVWFDPWQYQFDDNPVPALIHTVVETLEIKDRDEVKKILTVIAGAFSPTLLKAPASLTMKDIDDSGKLEEERFQMQSGRVRLREHFQKLMEKAQGNDKKRIVFFLDDLDRCMPVNVLHLLEALKLYLNFRNCIYFIGADRQALEHSVKHHYKDIGLSETSYLDKMVQLPFTIPPIDPGCMAGFIKPLLMKGLEQCQELLVKGPGDNPRGVKRIINTLTLNHQLAHGLSIPGYDPGIFALLLLIQKRKPDLFRIIARQPHVLQKLQLKKEETKHLREEFLTGDEALQDVLELAEAPDEKLLRQYIYLIEATRAREEDTNNTLIHLNSILSEHARWIKSTGKDGKKANLSGADLHYAKLDHANLEQAGLRDVSLIGANLKHTNLSGACLDHANLSDANLDHADLSGANLEQANMRDISLISANLKHANLSGTYLRGAILIDAKLAYTELGSSILDRANLSGADLEHARLREVSLIGANLEYARMCGARLSDANLSDANLSGANLSGANLSGANLNGVILIDAKLTYTKLGNSILDRANLSGGNLEQASLRNVSLISANLEHANLRGARLSGANLSGANLNSANLSGADLSGAILDGVNLAAAFNVTRHQLEVAKINESTIVPNHFDINAPE